MPRRTYPTVLILSLLAAVPLSAEVDPALLAGMKARAIGPAGMSGRIGDIAALPEDPDLIYVGAASGGLWRSTNGGLTFDPVFDDQPVASIGAVAIEAGNPDVLWVGTGEGNPRNSASVGNGVYRSLDRGETWAHLGLDKTEKIHRVALHPTRPEIAYVAALGTTWSESAERGVFKTTDGGTTWQKVLYVGETTGAADLVMDPANPNKLFAAMWDHRRWPWFFRSGGPGSGLHVTYDGGTAWKRLGEDDGLPKGELGRIGLAVCASDPRVVYALVEAKESAFLRSDDGGKSFRAVNTDPETANRPFYYADVRCDPRDPNRVYNLASRVSVSTDGGRTFDVLGGSRRIHGDYQALWINPRDPSHLVIGNDGGVGVSRDYGETWRFVASLPLGQYYHVAVDYETPYNVYGGLQDNGSWRGPSAVHARGGGFFGSAGIPGHRWQRIGFGDGFDVQPIAGDARRGYSMSQGGNLMRWDVETGGTRPIKPPEQGEEELRFNWNAALALDPFDADTLYYGSQYVHKSTDRGRSWTVNSPDLTTDDEQWQKQEESGGLTPDVTGAENFTTLVALAASPVERGVIWAGSDDGRLHVTRDGGATWTSVEAGVPGVPANTWIPRLEASRFDAAEAFVVFDDHRRANWEPYAYRTRDFGATWTRLADAGDVDGYALVLAQDPIDRDLLFLGTEFGLWVSLDGGGKWLKWTHGVPTASVMDLVVHPRDHDLVIATHGRSLFILDDVAPLRDLTDAVTSTPLHLFPIPAARQFLSEPRVEGNGLGHGEFEGENRPYGALLTFWLDAEGVPHPDPEVERRRKAQRPAPAATEESAGESRRRGMRGRRGGGPEGPQAEITVTDAAGDKVRSFKAPVHLGLNRAVWDLQRDAYEQPPRDRPSFFGDRGGPEVAPGTYTVSVKLEDHESTQAVEVIADPDAGLTAADWQAREAAFARVEKISADLAGAIEDIRDTRADLEVIERLARRAEKDESDPSDPSDPSDEGPHKALHDAIKSVRESLDALEKRLWSVPGTKGIRRRIQVESDIGYALRSLTATWEPPTPTDLAYLEKAETATAEAVAQWRRIVAEQVAPLSEQVEAAALGLLAVGPQP
jgi:photosystem II stability/assembly factor-like uncharacterized protein